jgi:photosystem II stability/assembly factor-like uncharacterized protein
MRGHILRSTDQGRTWTDVATGTNQSLTAAAELGDGTVVLVGLSGTVLRSADAGSTYSADVRPERQTFTGVTEAARGQWVLTAMSGIVKSPAPPR